MLRFMSKLAYAYLSHPLPGAYDFIGVSYKLRPVESDSMITTLPKGYFHNHSSHNDCRGKCLTETPWMWPSWQEWVQGYNHMSVTHKVS